MDLLTLGYKQNMNSLAFYFIIVLWGITQLCICRTVHLTSLNSEEREREREAHFGEKHGENINMLFDHK